MRPGTRLRSVASRVCARSTMDRLIDPVIADLQCEYEEANRSGRPWNRRRALVRGYVAFWKVLAVYVPAIWAARTMGQSSPSDHRALGRALIASTATLIVLTALFVALPLQGLDWHVTSAPWLFLLLLPQSFPQTLPAVVLTGALCASWRRPAGDSISRWIVVAGLTGSLASLGTIVWLIPAANQAFRVSIAGHHIVEGDGEIPVGSLRAEALAIKNGDEPAPWFPDNIRPRASRVAELLLGYHARWALAGAVLVFALLGLGLTALLIGRAATAAIGTLAWLVYVEYLFELKRLPVDVFSDERAIIGIVWLPNLLLIVASLVFLRARHTGISLSTAPRQ